MKEAPSRITPQLLTVERRIAAKAAVAYAAWVDPAAQQRWSDPGPGWTMTCERFDLRVGHGDVWRFGETGAEPFVNETCYLDIVPARRLVFASNLVQGKVLRFAGICVVDFKAVDAGRACVVAFTEQGLHFGDDDAAGHEAGWTLMLEQLRSHVEGALL